MSTLGVSSPDFLQLSVKTGSRALHPWEKLRLFEICSRGDLRMAALKGVRESVNDSSSLYPLEFGLLRGQADL